MADKDLKDIVKAKYGQAALRLTSGGNACCGSAPSRGECDPITSNLYDAGETAGLPAQAVAASLGCGNPTALAALRPGDIVLDLGSGGGIDVLLSAQRVGPTGKAYGLDMTDEMLALARENQRKAGVENVEFLKGEIEDIPLPDGSVDVIISNCVINLSADKDRVLAEAFRVLKPGGQLAVSDVVVRGEMPPAIRKSVELWIGCVAGALEEQEHREKLTKAGFGAIDLEPTRIYRVEDAREVLAGRGLDGGAIAAEVDGEVMSDLKITNTALKELRYGFKVFAPYGGVRKVSVFGSARTEPGQDATVAASEFGRRMVAEGWMVLTGAGGGIMGAAQEGAGGEQSFGLNIRLPWEQDANPWIAADPKLITFKYFFTRKLFLVKEANAVALFPGGFGTMDEGFELLTLMQTGKATLVPIDRELNEFPELPRLILPFNRNSYARLRQLIDFVNGF